MLHQCPPPMRSPSKGMTRKSLLAGCEHSLRWSWPQNWGGGAVLGSQDKPWQCLN